MKLALTKMLSGSINAVQLHQAIGIESHRHGQALGPIQLAVFCYPALDNKLQHLHRPRRDTQWDDGVAWRVS
jgi:hypothetical protein